MAAEPAPAIAGELLTLSEIQDLRRVSGVRSAMLVLHAWATIAGAMLLYALWPSVFTLILAIALVGARQLGLAVLVHEGVHWRLFEHAKVNNRIALWLCANPIWGELPAYRRRHHLHHRHTLDDDDPDLALSSPFPVPRAVLWRRVLCDLGGVTACSRVLGWPVWRDGFAAVWRRLRGPLAANAVLLGVLTALGHWPLYLLLWVLPLATWYQLASRVRDTAEHAMVGDAGDPLRNTRTITAGCARARVPGAVLGELPPRASSLRVRAVLASACGARAPARQGLRGADGNRFRLRRGSPARQLGAVRDAAGDDHASRRAGLAALVTVIVCWGLTWPVNKVLLEDLSPAWMMALRSAIATVGLFAIALARGRLVVPPRADLPVVLSITLLHMVGFGVLAAWGLRLVPTGRSVVLAYTTPLWVVPGAWLFLGERLTARRIIGVSVGLIGLVTLFNPTAFDWTSRNAILGNGAILIAALLWAASILHIRGHRWRATPLDLVPWEMLLATAIVTPLAYALDGAPAPTWSGRLVALLLYAGIPGTAVAYWATALASRNLPAVTTALGLLATPVLSVVVATLWLGEPLTVALVVAIVLILGGVAIGARIETREPR